MEIWKTIKNRPDYQISSYGRVKSLKSNRILACTPHSDGFEKVRLWQNGKAKNYLIHRLVAQAFLPNPAQMRNVSHIDGCKNHNNVNNLEWATQKAVVNRSWNLGNSSLHTSRNIKVYQFSMDGSLIHIFASVKEAAQAVQRSTRSITRALTGYFHSSAGFRWSYKEVITW